MYMNSRSTKSSTNWVFNPNRLISASVTCQGAVHENLVQHVECGMGFPLNMQFPLSCIITNTIPTGVFCSDAILSPRSSYRLMYYPHKLLFMLNRSMVSMKLKKLMLRLYLEMYSVLSSSASILLPCVPTTPTAS